MFELPHRQTFAGDLPWLARRDSKRFQTQNLGRIRRKKTRSLPAAPARSGPGCHVHETTNQCALARAIYLYATAAPVLCLLSPFTAHSARHSPALLALGLSVAELRNGGVEGAGARRGGGGGVRGGALRRDGPHRGGQPRVEPQHQLLQLVRQPDLLRRRPHLVPVPEGDAQRVRGERDRLRQLHHGRGHRQLDLRQGLHPAPAPRHLLLHLRQRLLPGRHEGRHHRRHLRSRPRDLPPARPRRRRPHLLLLLRRRGVAGSGSGGHRAGSCCHPCPLVLPTRSIICSN